MTELLHMMSNDETWRWQEQSRYYPAVQRNNQNTSTTSSSSERALQHGRRWEAPAYTGNHLVISVPGEYPSNHVQQHQYDNYQYARRQASEATNSSVRDPMEYMYPTVQRGEGYFNDLLPVHDEFEDVRILQAMLLAPDAEEEESKDARMPATAYHSRLLEEPLVPSMYFHRENDAASYPLLPTASPRRRPVHNDRNQSPSPASDVSLPSLQSSRRTTKLPSSRICRVPGCTKGIRSRGLCKAHGGGRRCTTPGCTISDQGGGHCIAHGGGKRCTIDGCEKSAQYKGLCKVHGGSRRCRVPDCSKNGQVKGLCRLHYSQSLQQEQGEDSDRANV
ncbi:hypothetical protein Poli38472_010746 [Pythium oligandrum]|uniref:WRKY19-like zinc finger domain-containing protein n=1 Tax=Pythium oligandrum TaxID=41045 RepID=A0A8K1CES1_PYTOL|nr:hypothetical protein Poli38472_010746 [Pythium oligandrum]|eukprot:TMW61683.1 hypothetical protein Poli38472_010746 [Pythium oligandrum]